jgi:hypothetical protein
VRRPLTVLVVVLVLLGVSVAAAEWVVRRQVEAEVTARVSEELAAQAQGPFTSVETTVQGLALRGVLEGRFDGVRVEASGGVVQGVPVHGIELVADGVSTDGRSVEALQATVRADAGALVASRLDPAVAAAVAASAVAVPPDQVRVSTPVEVADLGVVPAEVDVLFRASDGGVVVEPVAARAGGADVDLAASSVVPTYSLTAEELPAGLQVRSVSVDDVDGRPVLFVDLSCPSGCSLR